VLRSRAAGPAHGIKEKTNRLDARVDPGKALKERVLRQTVAGMVNHVHAHFERLPHQLALQQLEHGHSDPEKQRLPLSACMKHPRASALVPQQLTTRLSMWAVLVCARDERAQEVKVGNANSLEDRLRTRARTSSRN
jgi:hypothetical protein